MKSYKALVTEISMFLVTEVIAIYVGLSMISAGVREEIMIESTAEGIGVFGISMFIATLLIVVLIKYMNKRFIFKGIFAWLIFIGSLFVFEPVIGSLKIVEPTSVLPIAAMLSISLVVLRFKKPVVWVQNLAMILAIAGVSPQLAMYFGTPTIIAILLLASVYDYIAVFKTKHMMTMFENLMKHDTAFAFVIPEEGSAKGKVSKAMHKKKKKGVREYYLLGTGDIAFPTIFIVALLADYSPLSAGFALIGSIVGLVLDHIILMKLQKPIPALPTIAVCSILGFLLSLVVIALVV
ncbi:presenilin family intramembrane aspartyl protease [Candidatus Undinarchaeota archaeon]